MPPELDDPVLPEETNAPVEIFGDLPEDEDLTALDRGDVIEDPVPVEEPKVEDPVPAGDEPKADPEPVSEGEPTSGGTDTGETEPAAEVEPDEVTPEPEPVRKPEITIPKSRLDTQIARTRAAEAEVTRLRQANEEKAKADAPPEYDFKSKIGEEYEAVLQGDTEKAASIRMEIEEERMRMQSAAFQQMASQTTDHTRAQLEFDSVVADLTEDYPVFDPEHSDFSQELLDDVLFKRDAYSAQGMKLSDALVMATNEVAKLNYIPIVGAEPAAPVTKEPEKPKADRQDIEKKIAASNAQPPDIQGEASDAHGTTALDFDNMSEEEFDALPDSVIKRYRGD